MHKQKKNSIQIYGLIAIVTLIIALSFFYVDNNKGILKINAGGDEVSIFIDEEDKGSLNIEDQKNGLKIKKGEHSIILSKEGYWPWVSIINIERKQTINIYPFFIPKSSSGYIIPEEDPEYYSILDRFWTKTHINWEKNENTPKIVSGFESEIRASDFYKERQDVIIVAVENGIYALEINSSTTPNFQPIYKGTEPTFVKKDGNSIYVKDGEMLMEVMY